MRVHGLAAGLAAAGALAACATAANATVVFDFGVGPNGVATSGWSGAQGQTHTYTASGLSVTASAFGPGYWVKQDGHRTLVPDQLYGKNGGGFENGLGMTNDPSGEHEIHQDEGFIQLDVSALYGKITPGSLDLSFGSTTDGEQWTVYGSNTAGKLGSALLPTSRTKIGAGGTEGDLLNLTGGFKYYDIESTKPTFDSFGSDDWGSRANGKNVLIESLQATAAVPEPAAWGLMILGVFFVGATLRRQRRALAAA